MSDAPNIERNIATESAQGRNKIFSLRHTLRISSFQIGSAAADIFTASVWNRVMISDLGMPATWTGLLLAFQYFLLPISFWAGHRSDLKLLWGRRRTSYIWFGRGLMVITFPLLGMSVRLFEDGETTTGWIVAVLSFLLFGAGRLFSGSVFLALVRESVPEDKQGLAMALAETVLIGFFPIAAVAYGRWMETYEAQTFASMILVTAVLCTLFWFISIYHSDSRTPISSATASRSGGWAETIYKFRGIWQDGRVRRFFVFLFIATFAAWMQDSILEPFGADVFGLEAGDTTRFTGYWGGMTIVVLLASFYVWRRRHPETLSGITKVGLAVMAGGMLFLALISFADAERLLTSALLVFGAGFGFYSFGGFSLMAVMSPDRDAGAYLGLWTVCILLSKGLGTFAGGAFRDLFYLGLDYSVNLAYGLIFVVAAAGLLLAAMVLNGRQVISFALDYGRRVETAVAAQAAAD